MPKLVWSTLEHSVQRSPEHLRQSIVARFKPWSSWLERTLAFQKHQEFKLSWQQVSPEGAALLQARLPSDKAQLQGVWLNLSVLDEGLGQSHFVLDEALSSPALYQRHLFKPEHACEVLASDSEAKAVLLKRVPELANGQALLWLRPNTYPLECQKRALSALLDKPTRALLPLLRLALPRAQWPQPPAEQGPPLTWYFLKEAPAHPPEAQHQVQEQRDFVRKALATPDFALLDGPPGSGKTTVLCELILQQVMRGKRVLLVGSTHVAIDNLLERLLAWRQQDEANAGLLWPVRLGDEGKISPKVREVCLSSQLTRWQQAVHTHAHTRLHDPSLAKAHAYLDEALDDVVKGQHDYVPRLILDLANLVCGTTLGILQHPDIRGHKGKDTTLEPFDMLILDEASKTTFTEFLVPARLAKRWVLAGDIRQLSPFMGEFSLEPFVHDLVPHEVREAALWAFMASRPKSEGLRSLLAFNDTSAKARLICEAEGRNVAYVDLDEAQPSKVLSQPKALLGLLYADLVVGRPESLEAYETRLPCDLLGENALVPALPHWRQTRQAFLTLKGKRSRWLPQPERLNWSSELAWRMVRAHELRQSPSEARLYEAEIHQLLPLSLSESQQAQLQAELTHIRHVSMPSVLEMLLEGVQPEVSAEQATSLDVGLGPSALASRKGHLSYQRRMHADISKVPRHHFYQGHQLHDVPALSPSPWVFRTKGQARAYWVDIAPPRTPSIKPNENPAEADYILEHLRQMKAELSKHPRAKAPSVACLTFYRAQEALLRQGLQALCQQPQHSEHFHFGPIAIQLSTVDRFQGHEADLVLLSFVKSGRVGFLNSPNRLNVALTRAREELVLVGHASWFGSDKCPSPLLRALAESSARTTAYPIDYDIKSRRKDA